MTLLPSRREFGRRRLHAAHGVAAVCDLAEIALRVGYEREIAERSVDKAPLRKLSDRSQAKLNPA